MMELQLFGFLTEVDEHKTHDWYAHSSEWSCSCRHCRNFVQLAKIQKLPQPMMDTLRMLDIPFEKATYVSELFTDHEGIHYQVSYRLSGVILFAPSEDKQSISSLGRCCHEPYPYGAPSFPIPHFDLEFWITLPWILEEGSVST